MNEGQTAILFFARSAKAEQQAKTLNLSGRQTTRIFTALNQTSLSKATKTRLPLFVWDEKKQVGDTFGLRLCHAINAVFAFGYDQVIVLGNDCPELKTTDILSAQEALYNGKPVIGPNHDGGAYLIGLRKRDFSEASFEQLYWQTAGNLSALVHYFQSQQLTIHLLRPRLDVNQLEALQRVLISKSLSTQLRKLLSSLVPILWNGNHQPEGRFITAFHEFIHGLRAPPAY